MLNLPTVTLLGVDCVNSERLQQAMDLSEKAISFGDVKLLSSLAPDDSQFCAIPHIGSEEEYSVFCLRELTNYVDTDYVLVIQYDGFIVHPESWKADFLSYDYIGAPCSGGMWSENDPSDLRSGLVVGNGGFSLRSKRYLDATAHVFSEDSDRKMHPEDIAACVWHRECLHMEGITFAPTDLAIDFSVQQDYGEYEKPFGFHGLFKKNMIALRDVAPDFDFEVFLPKLRKKRGTDVTVDDLFGTDE